MALALSIADDLAAPYLPTPDDISAGCAAVQAEWDDAERSRRARWSGGCDSVPAKGCKSRRVPSTVRLD